MDTESFSEFLLSSDSLWVFKGNSIIFRSSKEGLLPLLDYIEQFAPCRDSVRIFDKIMGNAAALLSIKAGCREVYSPFGSELAVKTLSNYGIKYHILEIVPHIQNRSKEGMCPMEKLSLGKNPDDFYELLRHEKLK